jgi:hypothetical protein
LWAGYGWSDRGPSPRATDQIVAEGSGHLIPLEKPELVVDAIQSVIADVNKKAAHLAGVPP